MRRLFAALLIGALAPLACSADELAGQIAATFRRVANAEERVKLVGRIQQVGGARAVELLLGIVRRSTTPLERYYAQREALGRRIDGVFAPAIKGKRRLTASEDAGLQRIKASQRAADEGVAAELAGVRSALDALGKLKGEAARQALKGAASDRDWFVRLAVARALGQGLADKEPRVRIAGGQVLGAEQAAGELAALVKLLGDAQWQVRAVAVAALGRSGDPAAIGPLVERLRTEKGRLREDIDGALEWLTGYSFHGNSKLWDGWYAANKPKIDAGKFRKRKAGKRKAWQTRFSFYGIHSLSTRVVFVLDRSGSMRAKAQHQPPAISGKGRFFRPAGDRKIDVARAQLKTALANLPRGARFNVIFYNQGVIRLTQRLIPVNRQNLARAFQFIDSSRASGGTNIFDALFAAGNLLGARDAGLKLSRGNLTENPDTVFLLTDGYPNYGRLKKTEALIAEFGWLNRQRQLRVHCIGIGDHNQPLMRKLAGSTGGQYVSLK